ncbi:MAG: hydroxymethylglutaryl-CoA lyase [Gammaproteobacteria bacterium RIFCSPHIGHO2_12_FULL_45_9]|nr:MAG: hydroxymethylglutaryl-CoA lyase [Gammaproteobacteria bacterium RIFCSPHIGHO2_12_FULL_45_9]
MPFPTKVKLVEVGPRDGLQNESMMIPSAVKIELINRLSASGLSVIEASSFVSPKWIPQLADGVDVFNGIQKRPGVSYPVLVPNLKGLETALGCGVKEIAVFTTASEAFSQKNTHCTVEESLERIQEVIRVAKTHAIKVRGYLSCVLGCPYEGDIPPEKTAALALRLISMGCQEISLGDTIGIGTPLKTKRLIDVVSGSVPLEQLAVHFHDTYGQALVNIYAALERGVAIVDCAVAGLGGCPYAKGAGGNVSTEDVLYLLQGMGIRTGVDLDKVIEAGCYISKHIGRQPQSKVSAALRSD